MLNNLILAIITVNSILILIASILFLRCLKEQKGGRRWQKQNKN